MRKKSIKIKILNGIGFFFIVSSFFLILLSRKNEIYLDVGSVFLFIGIILSIPDYWIFLKDQKRRKDEFAIYWFVNFLTLPLMLVLLMIYFFLRLF
jgi:amino acid transporter